MKDEIKEIEEWLRDISTPTGLSYSGDRTLSNSMVDHIIDYITNLQEKYDIAQKDIEAMKHNYNLLVRLIENGESMTQKFENGLTYKDYKSRIDKAVEYIENDLKSFLYSIEYKTLLNILNGGDE